VRGRRKRRRRVRMKDEFLPEDACTICDIMDARSQQPLEKRVEISPFSTNAGHAACSM
jgi:hypothetical protein